MKVDPAGDAGGLVLGGFLAQVSEVVGDQNRACIELRNRLAGEARHVARSEASDLI